MITVYQADNRWYWIVRSHEGKVIVRSVGYKSQQGAVIALQALATALGLPSLDYHVLKR